jgi:hypothetical protein
LLFEPILFYRLNDWILFEGTIEADLPPGSDASFQLPVATAQIFLNDYMEINAGIFDQPFGDFYEDQSPVWVNRFVTAPLPYGVEALVPPTMSAFSSAAVCSGARWGRIWITPCGLPMAPGLIPRSPSRSWAKWLIR